MSTEIKPDSWSRYQLVVIQRIDRLEKIADNFTALLNEQGREQIRIIMESMKEIREEMTNKVDSSIRERNESGRESRREMRESQDRFEKDMEQGNERRFEHIESSLTAMGKVVAALKQERRDTKVRVATIVWLIGFLGGTGGTGIALLLKWILQ